MDRKKIDVIVVLGTKIQEIQHTPTEHPRDMSKTSTAEHNTLVNAH